MPNIRDLGIRVVPRSTATLEQGHRLQVLITVECGDYERPCEGVTSPPRPKRPSPDSTTGGCPCEGATMPPNQPDEPPDERNHSGLSEDAVMQLRQQLRQQVGAAPMN